MNILCLNASLSWGGNERWLASIMNGLAQRKHSLWLACPSSIFESQLGKEIPQILLPFKKKKWDWKTYKGLDQLIRRESIHLILSTRRKEAWMAAWLGRKYRIPVVFRMGIVRQKKWWNFEKKFVFRYLPQAIIVNAKAVGENLQIIAKVSNDKIHVIYNGYSFSAVKPMEIHSQFQIPEDAFVFATAGRLAHQKGLDILLKAFALAFPNEKSVYLLIAGMGEEEERLKKMARDLEINLKVKFLGFVENVRGLFAAADSVVISSRYEGIPNTLLEAWSVKKPVLTTLASGIAEVVLPGEDALAVSTELAELSNGLVRMFHSAELREKLAETGHERLKTNFGYSQMIEAVDELFNKLVKEYPL